VNWKTVLEVLYTSESSQHAFLKQVGKMLLYNMGCNLVDEEIKLNRLGMVPYTNLDNKKVIDVLGVGMRYTKPRKNGKCPYFHLKKPDKYLFGYNILRGIEVKVSRSDFQNGFNITGCNYNYLLTPMKLISPSVIPREVGLIEYNRYKFECSINEEETPNNKPFKIKGLRLVKKPKFRRVPQFHIDHAINQIALRQCNPKSVYIKVMDKLSDPELVYQDPV